MKTLVLYTFHEYNDRVTYFIKNALFQRDDVDFLVVCCDMNDRRMEKELPSYVKLIKRDNIGFDFGAWSDGIFKDDLYKNYDNFIFINSSVIGPFYPHYYPGNWTDIYIKGLTNNVKLFGSTICTMYISSFVPHVQSYIFAVDKESLEYLIKCNIFTNKYETVFGNVIVNKELEMSKKILENGWNIGCLHKHYKNVDFANLKNNIFGYKLSLLNDIMYQKYLDANFWDFNELVFVKGNRVKWSEKPTLDKIFQLHRESHHPHIPNVEHL
jgi:lipopolysaccharide biosynthesis protein